MSTPWDGRSEEQPEDPYPSGGFRSPGGVGGQPYDTQQPYANQPYADPYHPTPYGTYGPPQYNQPQYNQPHYNQPQYPYGYGITSTGVPPTSGLAVAALVCGIVGLVTAGLASIPAVICGHLAWPDTTSGRAEGHGMAVAGLILGYIPIAGWLIFWLFVAIAAAAGR